MNTKELASEALRRGTIASTHVIELLTESQEECLAAGSDRMSPDAKQALAMKLAPYAIIMADAFAALMIAGIAELDGNTDVQLNAGNGAVN